MLNARVLNGGMSNVVISKVKVWGLDLKTIKQQ